MYRFDLFPNEIVYCIFEFLDSADIVRIFSKFNQRYSDLVRIYVQKLDLTNGSWSKTNQQELQWILRSTKSLKIDQSHLYLLSDFDKPRTSVTSISSRKTPKELWRSMIHHLWTCSKKAITLDESSFTAPELRFSHIDTLKLVNVFQWNHLISKMNLKRLILSFDKENHYFDKSESIPLTIEYFTSNILFAAHYFHENLIYLNICVYSMVHLLEIIENTPKIQHLSIKFAQNFDSEYLNVEKYQSARFESMIGNVHRLTNLISLSISTKLTNLYFPFDQIRQFIDGYCPNETILKRVSLKFNHIKFRKDFWPTISRYKQIFDHFNSYISFIIEGNSSIIEDLICLNPNFTYHIEGMNILHVYSLPFVFQTLYGFTNCSNLSKKCSYLSVRNLYFTRIQTNQMISFEYLSKQMPNLIFIDCHCQTTLSQTLTDSQMFTHMRHLNFLSNSAKLFPDLIKQMPFLQILNTKENLFHSIQSPLMSVKRLDLHEYSSISLDHLCECVPHVTSLSLSQMRLSFYPFANVIGPFFSRLPNLKLISLKVVFDREFFLAWYRKLVQPVLLQALTTDSRLTNLKCTFKHDSVDFYLEN